MEDWAEVFAPDFDPAALGETAGRTLEKYAAASRAYLDSFTVPVGLTPPASSACSENRSAFAPGSLIF